MTELQIGDRVRCTYGSHSNQIGRVALIRQEFSGRMSVLVEWPSGSRRGWGGHFSGEEWLDANSLEVVGK